jgi:hypothetical protein
MPGYLSQYGTARRSWASPATKLGFGFWEGLIGFTGHVTVYTADTCSYFTGIKLAGAYYYYYYLTVIGLTPGGSSTVYIYKQTVHRIQRTKHT